MEKEEYFPGIRFLGLRCTMALNIALEDFKNFQAAIEEHIPRIIKLDSLGQTLIEKSEGSDSVTVEEELCELHRYCTEVIARLDRYHKRLLRIMDEPQPLDTSLFEDSELATMDWYQNQLTSSPRNSSPSLSDREHNLATSRGQHSARQYGSNGSGRVTPADSLEWDLYDMSHSELETKDNGALTDDGSIPEISPLEMGHDDVPLLQLSRGSGGERVSRRSHNMSAISQEESDLSPAKKSRSSEEEPSQHKMQFMNDLVATLAWLDATNKVTEQEKSKSESKFDKTIAELHKDFNELKNLQVSITQRKPIVLSIKLVSADFTDSDIAMKLARMNDEWESLKQKSFDWNNSLQESLLHSQEFQSTVTKLSEWIDSQNQRRDDITMSQHRENADSSPSSRVLSLRRNHKTLDSIRIDTLEAISKVTTMQDICLQLTLPLDGDRMQPIDGTRALSEKVRTLNGRLKALLEAVRSNLKDLEHKIKATRRRVREENSSASESESSTDTPLRSSTPIRLRMLQRKVDSSELHSCGKELNPGATIPPTADDDTKASTIANYDATRESCSSIDSHDVTHGSLHSRSKSNKSSSSKTVATKTTFVSTEKVQKGVAVTVKAKSTKSSKAVMVVKTVESGSKSGLCCRVCYYAIPFYILAILLLLLPWFLQATVDDGFGCLRQNNYAFSFTPMLTYTNGPPPV